MVHAAIMFALATVSHAAPSLGTNFEHSLGTIRQQLIEKKAATQAERAVKSASELDSLSRDASSLYWETWRQRSNLGDLRRRASRHQPPRPGQPQQDPFLRHDVQNAVWRIRDLARDADNARWRAQRALQAAVPDAGAVGAAQRLLSEARQLRSESGWLESEARWASMDLRRVGYGSEGWDLERESRRVNDAARELEQLAGQIVGRVTPPQAP